MLAVASNDGQLLAVLTQGIELVRESRLELLAGDVGELRFGDQGLSLSADELLLEHNNLGRVWLLVLQLCDLVGDLLLAYALFSMWEVRSGALGYTRSRLGCTDASMLRMLLIVTRYWS
jgi:hypothetical protein